MDIHHPLPLLAGLSPAQFMRRHWQKKPLLVRQAIADFAPLLSRAALFKLAARADVESRLIVKEARRWQLSHGPFATKSMPPLQQKAWTLLVQGVDLHHAGMHDLRQQFRFVPDARLDDVMVSFATPGGGVGPHFDSYDVFLLQASGRRRWRISQQTDLSLQAGVPLKILQRFVPEESFVLEAGDMLYLPPGYAHEGVALTDGRRDTGDGNGCMTYSIGFRAPRQEELAADMLQRLAEFALDTDDANAPASPLYRDPRQQATATPAALPTALLDFASLALRQALKDPQALACALGESLTEPKAAVWFDTPQQPWPGDAARQCHLTLDARSRMLYDAGHVFINGDSYRAQGADARLMHTLADQRNLTPQDLRRASAQALDLLGDWYEAGWLHATALAQ